MPRAVFMGTPEFALAPLRALAEIADIAAVYTPPPRAAGRGKALRAGPVYREASAMGLEIRTPGNFHDPATLREFAAFEADFALVVAWGQILPAAALTAPRLGCWNLHASLLPRWRGAAPVQRAVMAGDGETGIALMHMHEGLDEGPVYASCRVEIGRCETAGRLLERLSVLGAELLRRSLPRILNGELQAEPQALSGMCYAHKIRKEEAQICWARPAGQVAGLINGLSPVPGAWSCLEGERIKILEAECVTRTGLPENARSGEAGLIIDEALTVRCGTGFLRPRRLQRHGKKPLAVSDFIRGARIGKGARFG